MAMLITIFWLIAGVVLLALCCHCLAEFGP